MAAMYSLPSIPEMRRAYLASDAGYDGVFYLGVRTTGIFCRPSCRAKKPRPENVEYFGNPREATFAGYRACKRCHPLDAPGKPPAWIARLITRVESEPGARVRDGALRSMGIDPARARRYFQKHYGMSFHAYQRGRRMSEALQTIKRGTPATEVALGSGFASESGFREAFARAFGEAPSNARDCIRVQWYDSPIGPLLLGANDAAVVLLEFTERRMLEKQFDRLRRAFRCAIVPGDNPHLAQLKRELAEYFAGTRQRFEVPLAYPGSDFQHTVWSQLLEIPYGDTISYEELARRAGRPGACRAVGTANGMNRIAIVIPCHRVVNKSGALGGYGGGLWRKERLLDLERGQGTL
jgi:AraC family transcriptional regulator of adaptative response/methylated-DNA-[protein]-cysteine methyltransferase